MPLQQLPIVPIANAVLFPSVEVSLPVQGRRALAAVDVALARPDLSLVALTLKQGRPSPDDGIDAADLYHVGVRMVLRRVSRAGDVATAVALGTERVRLMGDFIAAPVPMGRFEALPAPRDAGAEAAETQAEIIHLTQRLAALGATRLTSAGDFLEGLDKDPLERVYRLALLLGLDVVKAQALLEAPRRIDALRLMRHYLASELRSLEPAATSGSEAWHEPC